MPLNTNIDQRSLFAQTDLGTVWPTRQQRLKFRRKKNRQKSWPKLLINGSIN
jgi:hypothetical protein